MSLLYDDNYEPASSMEMDSLLADLPFDLIKANIQEQIDDPMSNNINYVNVIVEKCDICKEMLGDDEDSIKQVDTALEEFFTSILQSISDRFDIGMDLNEMASSKEIVEIGEVIYDYFIIRYKKNISKYIRNYIKTHKSDLADYYADKSTKDVTTLSHKKNIKNPDDLIIIANLPSIINYIVNLDIDAFDFVDLSANKSNYDANVIKGLITSNRIIGNFVRKYIDVSLDDHDYLIDEIQTDIKVRIINKLT